MSRIRSALLVLATMLLALLSVVPAAHAAPPANDEPEGAAVITGLPYSTAQDTSEATQNQYGGCTSADASDNVWYAFTPDEDVRVEIDTTLSDYNTGLNVFAGPPGEDTFVACQERFLRFQAFAGTTYYVEVSACCGSTGGGNLVLQARQAPRPPEVSVTVDPVGTVDARTGVATVTGTLTCAETVENAAIDVFLRQRVGRFVVSGQNGANVLCVPGGDPEPWSVAVQASNGTFAGGFADAAVQAVGCTERECSFAFEEARIRLRR